jgi:hypothetical protein
MSFISIPLLFCQTDKRAHACTEVPFSNLQQLLAVVLSHLSFTGHAGSSCVGPAGDEVAVVTHRYSSFPLHAIERYRYAWSHSYQPPDCRCQCSTLMSPTASYDTWLTLPDFWHLSHSAFLMFVQTVREVEYHNEAVLLLNPCVLSVILSYTRHSASQYCSKRCWNVWIWREKSS